MWLATLGSYLRKELLHFVVAMSSSTKGPWDEINITIISIYKEKIIVMEETSWKKILMGVDISFLPSVSTEKTVTCRNAVPCFLIIFRTIVLFLPSQLVVGFFPRFSILCLLEYMSLPVSDLLKQNYPPWGSSVIAIEKDLQHKRKAHQPRCTFPRLIGINSHLTSLRFLRPV